MTTTVIVTAGSQGAVTQFASGPYPYSYLVGVAWDDPRPLVLVPRCSRYPIDWYTEEEFRDLLGVPVEGEYPSASEAGRPQGAVRRHCEAGRAPEGAA